MSTPEIPLVASGGAEYQRSRTLRRRGVLILALFAVLWAAVGASGLPPDLAAGAPIAGVIVSAAAAGTAGGMRDRRAALLPAGPAL